MEALRGEVLSGFHSGHVSFVIISDIKVMSILLGNRRALPLCKRKKKIYLSETGRISTT